MEHHLDRRVILNPISKYDSLYNWSLQELDESGKQIDADKIPWPWTLSFFALDLSLTDSISFDPNYENQTDSSEMVVAERRTIGGALRPGYHPKDKRSIRQTYYSMFGTDRTIRNFNIGIEKLNNEDEKETCTIWGSVSYTAEIDFHNETSDDSVTFFLNVRPDTFERFARAVASGECDSAVLRVGGVSGFYSDWSPSIATDSIKVLTNYEDHKVEFPDGCSVEPPRLGRVRAAALYLGRELEFSFPSEVEDDFDNDELKLPSVDRDQGKQIQAEMNEVLVDAIGRYGRVLSSTRLAAWVIAGLLLLILLRFPLFRSS